MLRKYYHDYEREKREIGKNNVAFYTGYTFEDWFDFIGLNLPELPLGFVNIDEFNLFGKYPNVQLSVNNANVFLSMAINLKQRYIYVQWFILDKPYLGTGRLVFEHIKSGARLMGFSEIKCRARTAKVPVILNGSSKEVQLNGSQVWGRFGFTMRAKSHVIFLKLMKAEKRNETCLQQLLLTEDGRNLWNEKIIDWGARFDLSEGSINHRLYERLRNII